MPLRNTAFIAREQPRSPARDSLIAPGTTEPHTHGPGKGMRTETPPPREPARNAESQALSRLFNNVYHLAGSQVAGKHTKAQEALVYEVFCLSAKASEVAISPWCGGICKAGSILKATWKQDVGRGARRKCCPWFESC